MELSTSIPIPRLIPKRLIILMDTPLKYMAISAVSTLKGILIATTSVGSTSLRKIARMSIASPAPMSIF